jgi:glutaryl-CoA dehydrogenase
MLDFYALEDLLTPEEKEIQKAARRFLEKEALPHIRDWWEEGVFPTHLIPRVRGDGLPGPHPAPGVRGGGGL